MAAINKGKIIITRCLEEDIPTLLDGEMCYTTDTDKLYIGNKELGNIVIMTHVSKDINELNEKIVAIEEIIDWIIDNVAGEQGPTTGSTTAISINGNTYTQVNGTITLPNYPTVPTKLSQLTNDCSYQLKTDTSLNTTSKTIPGAMNELLGTIQNLETRIAELENNQPVIVNVTGITLSTKTLSMNVNETSVLSYTITPSDATNQNVIWNSNNNSVVSVSNGVVTAHSAGQATITVTTEDGGYTATCLFTVSISGEVTIDNVLKTKSGDYLITKSGEYLAFKTPTSEPGGSEPGGSEPGGSEPGGTGILIENLGVTGIVNPMAVNQIVTLTIKYTPTDATERDVVWESLDTSALRIVSSDNDTCTIQPLKIGYSSLKVTAVKGGATKTFYFTTSLEEGVVAIESLGAKFETGASPMKVGSTATLTPKISPSNVTDSRVTWELIQQGEYARIESDYERCTITALSPGYFQIKISAVVGGASKVLYLQVIE